MPPKTLKAVLASCAALALSPFLPWMLSGVFDSIAEGWLGALAVTVPLGLGLAAVALAAHGLLLHGELVETLEEEFAGASAGSTRPAEQALVPAGGVAPRAEAAPAAAPTPARPTAGTGVPEAQVAVAHEPAGTANGRATDLGGKAKEKVRLAGKKASGRAAGRAKSKAKGAAQRNIREALRGLRPGG